MVKLARFHEIEIFTWALLSNHFHILLKEISDGDLVVERVREINGGEAAAELEWQLRQFREEMKHPELAEELKARYLARMGDVSPRARSVDSRLSQGWSPSGHAVA